MSAGRFLLIGALVVLCILFFAGVGIGFTQPSNGGLDADWTKSLGNVLIQPAQPGDLSPSPAICLHGTALTATGSTCSYALKAGFLGRKIQLQLVQAGLLGVLVTLEQPDVGKQTKRLLAAGADASLNYQKQGSNLRVQCLDGTSCKLQLVTG